MLTRIGLSSSRALASASSPHGYQSTGFSACWSRYGLVSVARRFGTVTRFLMRNSSWPVTVRARPRALATMVAQVDHWRTHVSDVSDAGSDDRARRARIRWPTRASPSSAPA